MIVDEDKEMLQHFKLQIVEMIDRHTSSGSRSNKLSEEDPDWVTVSLENCVSSDDRENFLRKINTDSYLLFLWHVLSMR